MDRRSWLKLSLSGTAALILGTDAPALQPRKIPPKGFRTGLAAIDDYAGCWDRGDLITIMGHPTAGKTAMGCQIAQINAKDGHKVVALVDGEEFQWAMCGAKTEWMPDSLADETQWRLILESIDADLIVFDAPLPYFYSKDYKDVGGLFQHRLLAINILMRHCHQHNRSAVFLFQTRRMPVPNHYYIQYNTTTPSLISYMSSRIFKIKKMRELDLVDVSMLKNRHGFSHGSFFYKHVVTPYGVRMVPVPSITLDSIDASTD
jgi:hypothetical protein